MMITLNPTYTLRVEIKDRDQPQSTMVVGTMVQQPVGWSATGQNLPNSNGRKFHNSTQGKTGCDEVLAKVTEVLRKEGLDVNVVLERFEYK